MGYRHCRHRSAAALVTAVIVIKPPRADYTAGAEGASIEGVETFANTSAHVETPVDYAQSPPAGGPHSATWLNCGVYTESVSNENAVHSLEHGAIWVTYNEAVGDGDLDVLKSVLPSTHLVLSPVNGLSAPVVFTGGNRQLRVDSTADPRIPAFLEEFWKSTNAPEPGASCAGGVDGPGKIA